eukprot:sb/3471552/
MTPLMCAANAGDYNLVSLLLDSDAHPNIAVPAQLDNTQVIPVETRKWTALSFAVLQGHTDIVKLMLSRGAAVEGSMNNPADLTTETPLQLAAAAGDIAIVELLLEKGADPFLCSTANNLCKTAFEEGNMEIVKYLLNDYECLRVEEFSSAFCKDGIVLLFEIFKACKVLMFQIRLIPDNLYI